LRISRERRKVTKAPRLWLGVGFGALLRENEESVTEESAAMESGEFSEAIVGLAAWQTTERFQDVRTGPLRMIARTRRIHILVVNVVVALSSRVFWSMYSRIRRFSRVWLARHAPAQGAHLGGGEGACTVPAAAGRFPTSMCGCLPAPAQTSAFRPARSFLG
jgi:hypothetical protein